MRVKALVSYIPQTIPEWFTDIIEEMQWCSGIIIFFSLQVFQTLKGSQVANQHLINTKGHHIHYSLSSQQWSSLSVKWRLWICQNPVCVLLLAPQQVWPKPKRNKTWKQGSTLFPLIFLRALSCIITTPLWFLWEMFIPALKFACFLNPLNIFKWLLRTSKSKREKFNFTHANAFQWQLKKILLG